ncbi:MAG: hypothetical protein F6J93_27425 [Oscillatoria sp. SIO1A7]|nr:hypothetical protein [Oscillatoria sp. SIO1A7]
MGNWEERNWEERNGNWYRGRDPGRRGDSIPETAFALLRKNYCIGMLRPRNPCNPPIGSDRVKKEIPLKVLSPASSNAQCPMPHAPTLYLSRNSGR